MVPQLLSPTRGFCGVLLRWLRSDRCLHPPLCWPLGQLEGLAESCGGDATCYRSAEWVENPSFEEITSRNVRKPGVTVCSGSEDAWKAFSFIQDCAALLSPLISEFEFLPMCHHLLCSALTQGADNVSGSSPVLLCRVGFSFSGV